MAQKQTDQKYFDLIMDFAKEIRMIPLPVRKEKSGYLLNSMLVPLLFSGMDLYVNGISDPESIDKAWTLGTGAPKGPFQILDTVGLTTAYNIVSMYLKVPSFLAPYNFKGMAKMLKKYIDEKNLFFKGIYSHLYAVEYEEGAELIEKFTETVKYLGKERFQVIHIQNSVGVLLYGNCDIMTHLRPGIYIYGLQEEGFFHEGLKQVFKLEGKIAGVRDMSRSKYLA